MNAAAKVNAPIINESSLLKREKRLKWFASDTAASLLKGTQGKQLSDELASLKGEVSLNWLQSDELEMLVKNIKSHYPILVIEQIPGLAWTEQILLSLKNFVVSEKGMLGLIWNSGLTQNPAHPGGTHWVGFVAVKNQGCTTLYRMDSANTQLFTDAVVEFISLTAEQINEKIKAL